MKLQITKNPDKPHVIKYIRDNATETWMQADEFFVRHDLSHYAIEKTLNFKSAFMGMLNNGMDIKDFENEEKRKQMTVTQEAMHAEMMANLFLMEIAQGNFEDFNVVNQQAFESVKTAFPPPSLGDDPLSGIRNFLRQLLKSWEELPFGQTMTLNFDL